MKLNFTVEVFDKDEDISSIEYEIIQEAARQLITEVMSNRCEHYGKTFREKLQDEVKNMMLGVMDADFKEELKNTLTEELSKKYIKSKQYKEVKDQFDIKSDTEIKAGLKDIVSELVNTELKKRFK
jgi:predicted house-cleaning noncanonical NTP pyrophosphatase (MazG superfamily)